MATRSEKARQIARILARRTFRGHWDLESLMADAESVSFQVDLKAPPHVKASTIAWLAIRRVKIKRHFRPSIRSIDQGWQDKRAKRPKYFQVHIDLEDIAASPGHNPADLAAFALDFRVFLAKWDKRKRAILEALAVGNKTSEVAARFGVSDGRISQLRREFESDWEVWQHDSMN